jgi:hypothetical protein
VTFVLVILLLAKITLILLAGLTLDVLLHAKWLLPMAAMWNAVVLAILVLPAAMLWAPQWVLPLLPRQSPERNWPTVASLPISAPTTPTPDLLVRRDDEPMVRTKVDGRTSTRSVDPRHLGFSGAAEVSSTTAGNVALVILGWVYALGAAIAMVRLVANLRAVHVLRCHAQSVTDGSWLARMEHWQVRLGLAQPANDKTVASIRPPVRLLHSNGIEVPVALGAFQRAVVIPSRLVADASNEAVDSIIVHELAHIARADYAWQLLERVVQCFLWFHPLWWICVRRIAFLRERACDDFAVHALDGVERYASTLLDLAAVMIRRHRLGLGLTVLRSPRLARRLAAIQRSAGNTRCNASRVVRWSFVSSAVLGAVLLAGLEVRRAVAQDPRAPDAALTIEELLRRQEQTIEKIHSYDVYLDVEYRWPLKTVVVPIIDPANPAHREGLEWRAWEPGELPKFEIHSSRQVRAANGKRRVEKLGDRGGIVVFDGTTQKVLNESSQNSPRQGSIGARGQMIEEGEDYEDYFARLWMQSTLAQILAGRPSARITIVTDKGLILIDAPAGEGQFNTQFGWRIWLDPKHGYLPAKYELLIAKDGKESELSRSVEITKFKSVGDGAWVPVDLISYAFNNNHDQHVGEVVNIVHASVDVARSHWNSDLPESLFVLAFPPGVQVIDMARKLMFTTGEGDTGHDDQQLLNNAKQTISVGAPEPPKRIDLALVPLEEREAVAQLVKWLANISLENNGSVRSVSFDVDPRSRSHPGMGGSNMFDDGMPLIGKLQHLKTLRLGNTEVTDTGLSHVKDLSELQRLSLENTKITDEGLKNLAALTALKWLHLDNNVSDGKGKMVKRVQITDDGLANLKGLRNLELLDLRGTDITDAGLEHLKSLSKLQQLSLNYTNVTEAGVKALKDALPSLKDISVGR